MRLEAQIPAIVFVCLATFHAVDMQAAGVQTYDFSRYSVILERRPFGEPPPEPSSTNGPAAPLIPYQAFKDIRLVLVTKTPGFGVRVGLVDLASKKQYFLPVGGAEDGLTVVDADYEKGCALVRKGAEECWIDMNGQINGPSSKPAASTGVTVPVEVTVTAPGATGGLTRVSYVERLRLRREAREARLMKQLEESKKISPEELEQQLKEYQMEIIRSGEAPPLPIPLTKEMDDQLVQEGVLPPLDEAAGQGEAAPEPGAGGE